MSIVFIGTPAFAVPSLRRLVSAGHAVSAVITQPDRPAGRGRRAQPSAVKVAAAELGLTVLQPPSLRDPQVLEQIAALRPEAMVAVAYGQILRREFLDIAPRGVLNVHPSLLPRYRGASPIPATILAGDEETGVTIMLMDAGMDSGPILSQAACPISPEDTTGSLTGALADLGAQLLVDTLPGWLSGEIEPRPQDDSLASVTRLLQKDDGIIDWARPAVEIWRQARAYSPWPGATTRLDGELLRIWRCRPLSSGTDSPPGTVLALPLDVTAAGDAGPLPAAFAIQTGEGLLAPLELQREGRRRLAAAEFLRGLPGLIGKRLG